ncbi:response regulator [Hymenobacter armeniacus]|uniref:Response regulator transcription factor n=1 Tax=Hymenobacter armeniacus TaxID=2771358 RepID=A0ABR8JRT6_9BACT|nr:response regulator transcription factor [Hymenobacter armeniacus]MBD2721631.1 response regulator transcription factor [Hymenobacter armeniacus]
MPVSLAIIEDVPAVRQALHTYLCAQPEFDCVLAVGSVEDFLAQVKTLAAPPRLVLSDIGLPGKSGIEGVGLIRAQLPGTDVVLLTTPPGNPEWIFQGLCAGAVGYFLKNTPLADLKAGLISVAEGGSSMSPAVARQVVKFFQPAAAPEQPLTPREQQVVQAIEEGLSYKLIAARLGIGLDTVRGHIKSIYGKLHINSKGELLARNRRW